MTIADYLKAIASGVVGLPPSKYRNDWGAERAAALGEMVTLAPALLMGGLKAVTRGARMGPQTAPAARQPIKAYHGSPHDFDQFSLEKIGTGEGAQAYGHGLYFAENEGVAKSYHKALSPVAADGHELPSLLTYADPVRDRDMFMSELKRVTDNLDKWEKTGAAKKDYMLGAVADAKRIKAGIEAALQDASVLKPKGRMYEVNLHVSPDELLDWDKPLSQQSETIRVAALKAYGDVRPVKLKNGRYAVSIVSGDQSGRVLYAIDEATADAAMQAFHHQYSNYMPGSDIYQDLQRFTDRNPTAASDALKRQGIKGIRYKDAGSRGMEGGTSNYVMFDDAVIEIAKKYGIALPMAAALLKARQAQQDQLPPGARAPLLTRRGPS